MEPVTSSLALVVLALLFVGVSTVYASVGLGGGSSYTAILAIVGVSASHIAPTALALNLVVAGIAFYAFLASGHVRWSLLVPVVVWSIPASFLGGWISFQNETVLVVLATALAVAAVLLVLDQSEKAIALSPSTGWPMLGAIGAGLGFLAGMTGIGGGIFLVPVLMLTGLADEKQTAPIAAAFVWLNSAAGLLAHAGQGQVDWTVLLPLTGAVAAGGWIGSTVGASVVSKVWVRRFAAMVLSVAALQIFIQLL
jgi:uncharacterized membrane protein YfcA